MAEPLDKRYLYALGGAVVIGGGVWLGTKIKMATPLVSETVLGRPPTLTKVGVGGKKMDDLARDLLSPAAKWATMFGCPPSLLMAVIENESKFNPKATNMTGGDLKRGGAWGLGQLTLTTALEMDKASGAIGKVHWSKWNKTGPGLLDMDVNLAMSAYGLAKNWKRYETSAYNWLVAGTAWNTGIGSMDKKVATARQTANWAPILSHPYAIHILAIRKNRLLTAQLYAQEGQSKLFRYSESVIYG